MPTQLNDVMQINLNKNTDEFGTLIAIEQNDSIPIEIKRAYYVYNSGGNVRGNHAHRLTKQVLICINGKIVVTCSDGIDSKSFTLCNPETAIFVPELIWDSVEYCTDDSVLLVFANRSYDKSDYILDLDEFKEIKTQSLQ